MTPIPVNPTVVVYIDPVKGYQAHSSNVAEDLTVVVVSSQEAYMQETLNKPFDSANPRPQTQVLAMKK